MDETAVVAAIFAKLQGDSDLQTLLEKTSSPYGVYRHGFLPRDPAFPIVTLEFIGGPTSTPGAWEMNTTMLSVRVYHGDPAEIHARVQRLLNQPIEVITATDAELVRLRHESKGPDLWDDDFQVHYRVDNYILQYRLFGETLS